MGAVKIPCDGKCEVCKYSECILTDEQVDLMEGSDETISPQLANYYTHRESRRKQQSIYHKEYYKRNREKIIESVLQHKRDNREHYRQYEREHPRDRKEYQRQYYLKKKMEKNKNGKNEIVTDGVVDDLIAVSTRPQS